MPCWSMTLAPQGLNPALAARSGTAEAVPFRILFYETSSTHLSVSRRPAIALGEDPEHRVQRFQRVGLLQVLEANSGLMDWK